MKKRFKRICNLKKGDKINNKVIKATFDRDHFFVIIFEDNTRVNYNPSAIIGVNYENNDNAKNDE